jgi:serine/threonine-protein kinase
MGEVYLARRRAAGVEQWLVVKRMRPERSGDTRFLDLFMREARLSMSLTHQNIVPVFDFGRIDDQVFLAMERVEGKDLGSSLQKAGKGLPPMLAAFIAVECLQALDYAHQRKGSDGALLGIVHRDVTPRNVLLSWSGEVKLTDFGIAALAGDSPSRAAGTPAYMAPEQARGEATDVRADLYAVGLVLREALTGERARSGNDRETVLQIAKQGVLEPWPDTLDTPLRAIAERATAAAPADRYPDARAMLEDLDTFLVAERAAKKSESPSRQLGAWLTNLWKDTKDDVSALDAQIEAGVLVSFIDDGLFDVAGAGTQLSALATAADDAAVVGPSQKIEVSPDATDASATSGATRSAAGSTGAAGNARATTSTGRATAGSADAAETKRATTAAERATAAGDRPDARVAASPASRLPLVLLSVALLAALGFIAWRATRHDDAPRTPAITVPVGPPLDAATQIAEATPDAAPAIVEAPADAAVAASTHDAGSSDARDRPRPNPLPSPRDAGVPRVDAAAAVAPATAKRKVTINSKPWSNWTVDDGPQHAGLETIELTPGPHTIHFTGQQYFKADKTVTITVPDKDGFTFVQTLEAAAPPEPAPVP